MGVRFSVSLSVQGVHRPEADSDLVDASPSPLLESRDFAQESLGQTGSVEAALAAWPVDNTGVMSTGLMRALVLGLTCGLVACSPLKNPEEASAPRSCEEVEAVDYPAMETRAKQTLSLFEYRLERVGQCETTGSPRAVLYAYVETWPTREFANKFFLSQGWIETDGWLVSQDGAYRVNNITSVDPDSPDSYVTVEFYENGDRG